MRDLDQGYTAEVDLIDKSSWNDLLLQFKDVSYYQTWSFGAIHSGEKHLSHLILKKDGNAVGMAQLRIGRIPKLSIGIAYLSRGPIFMSKYGKYDDERLSNMLRALYNEYVLRRRYFLRIVPNTIDIAENAAIKSIYANEGFSRSDFPGQTVLVDLSKSLDEIRQNMDRKWRQTLQSAEKKAIDIIEGNNNEACQMALKVIGEMKTRKGFLGGNQSEAIKVNLDLPESLKLKLAVSIDNKEPVAALGWVTVGTVGIPLVAATGYKALKTKSSYVLWWRMIEYYKGEGYVAVDMGGVNKKRNPGGYYFKTHILGKRLKDQPQYIGQFDAWPNYLSWAFFMAIYKTREIYRNVRSMA
jgi:lipid II:glycine glycyltransferase (peptidoglycan interpeptide bridge formation enzyme)